jgi:hypothetical protein
MNIDLGQYGRFVVEGTVASGSPFALVTFRASGAASEVGIDLDKRIWLGTPPVSLQSTDVEEIAARMNQERVRMR